MHWASKAPLFQLTIIIVTDGALFEGSRNRVCMP
jgi:hypothetical protein